MVAKTKLFSPSSPYLRTGFGSRVLVYIPAATTQRCHRAAPCTPPSWTLFPNKVSSLSLSLSLSLSQRLAQRWPRHHRTSGTKKQKQKRPAATPCTVMAKASRRCWMSGWFSSWRMRSSTLACSAQQTFSKVSAQVHYLHKVTIESTFENLCLQHVDRVH